MKRSLMVVFGALAAGCPQPIDEPAPVSDAGLARDDAGSGADGGQVRGPLVAVLSGAIDATRPCTARALDEGQGQPTVRVSCGGATPWIDFEVVCFIGAVPQPGTYSGVIVPPATTRPCTAVVLLGASDGGVAGSWSSRSGTQVSVTLTEVTPRAPDAGLYDLSGSAFGAMVPDAPFPADGGAVSFTATF